MRESDITWISRPALGPARFSKRSSSATGTPNAVNSALAANSLSRIIRIASYTQDYVVDA